MGPSLLQVHVLNCKGIQADIYETKGKVDGDSSCPTCLRDLERVYTHSLPEVSLCSGTSNAIVANEILDRVASGTVLDVGTGPGCLPTCIAIKNPSLEVVGLDVSRDMIKIARANAKRAHAENVHVLVGDAAEIGMPNESVDLAVATLSFHHLSKPPKAFEELYGVLKSGGEVWIYEVNSDLTPQSEAWMKGRYNIVTRKIARSVMRMLNKHTMTAEHATAILRDHKNRFADAKVGQLEPLLVKIVLVKK